MTAHSAGGSITYTTMDGRTMIVRRDGGCVGECSKCPDADKCEALAECEEGEPNE